MSVGVSNDGDDEDDDAKELCFACVSLGESVGDKAADCCLCLRAELTFALFTSTNNKAKKERKLLLLQAMLNEMQ